MKKFLAIILTLSLMAAFTGCGKKASTDIEIPQDEILEEELLEEEIDDSAIEADEEETDIKEEKPSEKPTKKPTESKPSEKPASTPETKPSEKPSEKPEVPSTLGRTLLQDFKKKASSGMNSLSIAEALLTNPAIKFAGGAMPVEEGLLSGFDNAEIKGFKEGAMFAPMIGSIAFVGYVFEMPEGADVSGFIQTLEKNANKRWNICVEAEEMVTGTSGNKVFFVMCPKSLDE